MPCAPELTTRVWPDGDGPGQAVVGVAAEDHVDAAHAARHLHVGRQAVVAQEHDHVHALDVAELVDEPLGLRLLDAEGEAGDEARGVRHGHVGEGLADDARRRRRPTWRIAYGAKTGSSQLSSRALWQTKSPWKTPRPSLSPNSSTTRSSPWVNSQCGVNTSTPSWFITRTMSRPRVHSAVAEPWRVSPPSRSSVRPGPRRADAPDQRRDVRVAPHPAVARGERLEVEVAQGVRLGRSARDPVRAQQRLAGQERRLARLVAHPDQRVRLAVVDGVERAVGVGHVEQGDVAERPRSRGGAPARAPPPARAASARRGRRRRRSA